MVCWLYSTDCGGAGCVQAVCYVEDGRCLAGETSAQDCGCLDSEAFNDPNCIGSPPCEPFFHPTAWLQHGVGVNNLATSISTPFCEALPATNTWYSFAFAGRGDFATVTTCGSPGDTVSAKTYIYVVLELTSFLVAVSDITVEQSGQSSLFRIYLSAVPSSGRLYNGI